MQRTEKVALRVKVLQDNTWAVMYCVTAVSVWLVIWHK